MCTDRADLRSLLADVDMSAVTAFPAVFSDLDPDFAFLNVGGKFVVAVFMALFDLGNGGELSSQLREAFGGGFFGKLLVHLRPFFMFACGSRLQVFERGADSVQRFEPEFRMFFFIVCGLLKDGRNLLETFLLRFACKVGVLVARLGFSRKCVPQIGFGL